MEPFIVSARKYRPQHFEEVVGQQAITRTLQNAIDSDHLAQALLFCGPRGVGKTTCARILARKINEDGNHKEGEDFAFNIFELDAASNNSVDDIRNLIDQVRIPPQIGKYKVYIIDEVHMLSQAAFNAFLKTLEEPPKHAVFILATTEKHKIIPTILSRCQIFDFRRITVKDAAEHLKYIAEQQGIEVEDEALHMIAQKADGAMRDALSIFDRVVSFAGKTISRKAVAENLNLLDIEVYFNSTDLILSGDIPGLLLHFNEVLSLGFEGHHYINGLASHFRNLMVCRHENTVELLETAESTRQKYLEQSGSCPDDFLLKALDLANQCDLDYKTSKNQRLLVELCLMKLASLGYEQKKKPFESEVQLIPASAFREDPAFRQKMNVPAVKPSIQAPELQTAEASGPANKALEEPRLTTLTGNQVKESPVPRGTIAEKEPAGPSNGAVSGIPERREKVLEKSGGELAEVQKESPSASHTGPQRVSGLSLSSIRAKKAHQARKSLETPAAENLPRTPFTETDLRKHWKAYAARMEKKGQKILASNLNADEPKLLQGEIAWIELPNGTMKKEVEREQHGLLQYLRKHLDHYGIRLKITVNEETAKQYAFTPEEKYEKLREKNPAIDMLRKAFDLEL